MKIKDLKGLTIRPSWQPYYFDEGIYTSKDYRIYISSTLKVWGIRRNGKRFRMSHWEHNRSKNHTTCYKFLVELIMAGTYKIVK